MEKSHVFWFVTSDLFCGYYARDPKSFGRKTLLRWSVSLCDRLVSLFFGVFLPDGFALFKEGG